MTVWLIAIGFSIVLSIIGFAAAFFGRSSSFLPMFL